MSDPVVIHVTERCNSDCRMCSVREGGEEHDRDREEIFSTLEKSERGTVDFTGGEPTVNEELPEIIRRASRLGYKRISISTNGRKLADEEYFEELVEAGLEHATVALHSIDEETSEAITGHPENFEETREGIENLASCEETRVSIGTVPMKPNIDRLDEIAELLLARGVESWNLTGLKPEGPEGSYRELAVSKKRLAEKLEEMKDLLSRFEEVVFYNFTRCELPPEVLGEHSLVTVYDKNAWKFDMEDGESQNDDGHTEKKKVELCESCPYSEKCFGFWKEDLTLFEEETLENAAKNLETR